MRALLDTHVLLWWLAGSDRLPPEYAELIAAASGDGEGAWGDAAHGRCEDPGVRDRTDAAGVSERAAAHP